ncbi:methyltransferase domain-containing protein [Sphingomonas montanisoli]|uniref:Methyltransferase domain-containing protein n=1 Tax=Sphingomonas montanisoli TaxID=2606412 RepID=A0A5D9C5S4_9SPHN|nr:methyltransferase domain-containing protein [Sphingomonas montanisoli]TZG27198.1 methyltransferase domain-containing protein [Sphingomonas montanisoli]
MIPTRTDRIARAFGAAQGYDSAASVQRVVASELAQRITSRALSAAPKVLEIGCGTGFLTGALAPRLPDADWTVSDLAPEMIDRARDRLGLVADYRVIDGADPAVGLDGDARFDLICSSLAFQWFGDLRDAIARNVALLRPGGLLAFATMAAGSFDEWRAAVGGDTGVPHYPDAAAIRDMAPAGTMIEVETGAWQWCPGSGRAFLASLKAIGAGVAADGYRPLSPGALRAALDRFDAAGATVSYHITFAFVRAGE